MPKKIFIIDDEADMRVYLQTLFRKAGFDTETAVNGEEALSRILDFGPDLVTLDILMPKRSGLNFFEALRSDEQTRDLPVVVISGVTGHHDFFGDEQMRYGVTVFADKPIDPDSLLSQVNELIGG